LANILTRCEQKKARKTREKKSENSTPTLLDKRSLTVHALPSCTRNEAGPACRQRGAEGKKKKKELPKLVVTRRAHEAQRHKEASRTTRTSTNNLISRLCPGKHAVSLKSEKLDTGREGNEQGSFSVAILFFLDACEANATPC
jgi:hypothetical protein